MGFSYNVNVLNQKGSPALYTDIFANRPAAGYQGRLFISTDTAAIYEDTGTAWTLIANVSSGAGTLQQVTTNGNTSNVGIVITAGGLSTNSLTDTALTSGSVTFAGAGGLISEDNANLFWDDTNNRLGINTNTPGNTLDVHTSSSNPTIAVNNTAALQSAISFLNTSVAKWRIGNTAINSFDIYNFTLAAYAMTINNASNAVVMSGTLNANEFNLQPTGYSLLASLSRNLTGAGYGVLSLRNSANGTIQPSSLTVDRTYTLPDATGTIALTSNLSSYVPYTGATTTVNLGTQSISAGTGTFGTTGALLFLGTSNTTDKYITIQNSSGNLEIGTNSTTHYLIGNGSLPMQLFTNGTSRIFIGATTGNVLLGSTTDDTVNKLQVTGNGYFSGNLSVANANTAGYITGLGSSSGNGLMIYNGTTGNSYVLNVLNSVTDGSVLSLYGADRTTIKVQIKGDGSAKFDSLAGTGSRAVIADANGLLSAPVSDQSVKENIEPLKYGLETIMKLNAVQFEFIEKYKNYGEGLQIGAIAQEVEEIIPEAVFKTPSTGLKGINYDQFNGIYIKAIQDQQKIIESLIQRIELLENK